MPLHLPTHTPKPFPEKLNPAHEAAVRRMLLASPQPRKLVKTPKIRRMRKSK
jgi:hypothetical protein